MRIIDPCKGVGQKPPFLQQSLSHIRLLINRIPGIHRQAPLFRSRRHAQRRFLNKRCRRLNRIRRRLDPEPRDIERRQEQKDQHRADRRAADQRIGQPSIFSSRWSMLR